MKIVPVMGKRPDTGVGDNETRRFLMGMVEAGGLVLAVLTPRYLATWGL